MHVLGSIYRPRDWGLTPEKRIDRWQGTQGRKNVP